MAKLDLAMICRLSFVTSRQRLHLAQLLRVLAQLAQRLVALHRGRRREVVVAHGDNARDDRDDLRQVLIQRRRWRRAAHAREHTLDGVDYRLGLGLKVRLQRTYQRNVEAIKFSIHLEFCPRIL